MTDPMEYPMDGMGCYYVFMVYMFVLFDNVDSRFAGLTANSLDREMLLNFNNGIQKEFQLLLD